jgi:hypothetical protein
MVGGAADGRRTRADVDSHQIKMRIMPIHSEEREAKGTSTRVLAFSAFIRRPLSLFTGLPHTMMGLLFELASGCPENHITLKRLGHI